MDDRYPVSFGYPDKHTPSGMKVTPRLRGNLSKERFTKWGELMASFVAAENQIQEEAESACTATLPPTGQMLVRFDVMIQQRYELNDFVSYSASLSYSSITGMAEYLKHWCAVEDELEAEQRGVQS